MERAAIIDAFELDRQIGLGGGLSGETGPGAWGVNAGLFGQNASDQENNRAKRSPAAATSLSSPTPRTAAKTALRSSTWAPRRAIAISTTTPSTARSGTVTGRSSTSPARAASIPGPSRTPKATSGSARSSPGSRARSRSRASSRIPSCSARTARTTPTISGAAISAPATS
jgi:hypothetical protein